MPGRFTGAMLVAGEKRLDSGFGAAGARLANLRRSGALITSPADCGGQGMTGPVRLGLRGSPRRWRAVPGSGPAGAS